MSRKFRSNPFETSPEDEAARLESVRAERIASGRTTRRERWEALGTGDDGVIANTIMDTVENVTREGGPLDEMVKGAGFEDPNAEIGALAAGITHRFRGDRPQK